MSDLIDDTYRRLVETLVNKLGTCEQTASMVAAEFVMDMRRDWAGERPYIGSRPVDGRQGERNRAIIRAVKDGNSLSRVAREHKISRERVRQIVNG